MSKICYSLGEHSLDYCVAMNRFFRNDAIELRLDLLPFEENDLKQFFQNKQSEIITTYLIDEEEEEAFIAAETEKAATLLAKAIVLGTDYITIPYDFNQKELTWLTHLAWNYRCKVIIAYHNKFGTPSTADLNKIAKKCYSLGADIVKIVTTAHHPAEAKRVLKLYDTYAPETLIAFAMGEAGTESRRESYAKGAPFMFATTLRDYSTAKGQLTFYDLLPESEKREIGKIFVPSSKSLAIRAIIAASLTNGKKSILTNIDFCDDVTNAVDVARQLFADVTADTGKGQIVIVGHQNIQSDGLRVRDNYLNAGESGLLAHICISLAGLSDETITVTGEKTLLERRFNEHSEELKRHGLHVSYTRRNYLPAKVKGKLTGGEFSFKGDKGSQMISGLLFALPYCKEYHTITITNPTSLPYILMTLSILNSFGITIENYNENGDLFEIEFAGNQSYRGCDYSVETDWSAAALWLVAGVLAGESGVENLQYDSLQADSLIMDTFEACGADIGCYNYETGSQNDCFFQANRSVCIPFEADLTHNPDLAGPLILLA
ncbi:MAG: type I 3-dehydroquinate dehydratase, partial [Bacteroidales bacterium]|nr:type I 3-dehydroquinate dehydratase [Bacteroidales bacterium]